MPDPDTKLYQNIGHIKASLDSVQHSQLRIEKALEAYEQRLRSVEKQTIRIISWASGAAAFISTGLSILLKKIG